MVEFSEPSDSESDVSLGNRPTTSEVLLLSTLPPSALALSVLMPRRERVLSVTKTVTVTEVVNQAANLHPNASQVTVTNLESGSAHPVTVSISHSHDEKRLPNDESLPRGLEPAVTVRETFDDTTWPSGNAVEELETMSECIVRTPRSVDTTFDRSEDNIVDLRFTQSLPNARKATNGTTKSKIQPRVLYYRSFLDDSSERVQNHVTSPSDSLLCSPKREIESDESMMELSVSGEEQRADSGMHDLDLSRKNNESMSSDENLTYEPQSSGFSTLQPKRRGRQYIVTSLSKSISDISVPATTQTLVADLNHSSGSTSVSINGNGDDERDQIIKSNGHLPERTRRKTDLQSSVVTMLDKSKTNEDVHIAVDIVGPLQADSESQSPTIKGYVDENVEVEVVLSPATPSPRAKVEEEAPPKPPRAINEVTSTETKGVNKENIPDKNSLGAPCMTSTPMTTLERNTKKLELLKESSVESDSVSPATKRKNSKPTPLPRLSLPATEERRSSLSSPRRSPSSPIIVVNQTRSRAGSMDLLSTPRQSRRKNTVTDIDWFAAFNMKTPTSPRSPRASIQSTEDGSEVERKIRRSSVPPSTSALKPTDINLDDVFKCENVMRAVDDRCKCNACRIIRMNREQRQKLMHQQSRGGEIRRFTFSEEPTPRSPLIGPTSDISLDEVFSPVSSPFITTEDKRKTEKEPSKTSKETRDQLNVSLQPSEISLDDIFVPAIVNSEADSSAEESSTDLQDDNKLFVRKPYSRATSKDYDEYYRDDIPETEDVPTISAEVRSDTNEFEIAKERLIDNEGVSAQNDDEQSAKSQQKEASNVVVDSDISMDDVFLSLDNQAPSVSSSVCMKNEQHVNEPQALCSPPFGSGSNLAPLKSTSPQESSSACDISIDEIFPEVSFADCSSKAFIVNRNTPAPSSVEVEDHKRSVRNQNIRNNVEIVSVVKEDHITNQNVNNHNSDTATDEGNITMEDIFPETTSKASTNDGVKQETGQESGKLQKSKARNTSSDNLSISDKTVHDDTFDFKTVSSKNNHEEGKKADISLDEIFSFSSSSGIAPSIGHEDERKDVSFDSIHTAVTSAETDALDRKSDAIVERSSETKPSTDVPASDITLEDIFVPPSHLEETVEDDPSSAYKEAIQNCDGVHESKEALYNSSTADSNELQHDQRQSTYATQLYEDKTTISDENVSGSSRINEISLDDILSTTPRKPVENASALQESLKTSCSADRKNNSTEDQTRIVFDNENKPADASDANADSIHKIDNHPANISIDDIFMNIPSTSKSIPESPVQTIQTSSDVVCSREENSEVSSNAKTETSSAILQNSTPPVEASTSSTDQIDNLSQERKHFITNSPRTLRARTFYKSKVTIKLRSASQPSLTKRRSHVEETKKSKENEAHDYIDGLPKDDGSPIHKSASSPGQVFVENEDNSSSCRTFDYEFLLSTLPTDDNSVKANIQETSNMENGNREFNELPPSTITMQDIFPSAQPSTSTSNFSKDSPTTSQKEKETETTGNIYRISTISTEGELTAPLNISLDEIFPPSTSKATPDTKETIRETKKNDVFDKSITTGDTADSSKGESKNGSATRSATTVIDGSFSRLLGESNATQRVPRSQPIESMEEYYGHLNSPPPDKNRRHLDDFYDEPVNFDSEELDVCDFVDDILSQSLDEAAFFTASQGRKDNKNGFRPTDTSVDRKRSEAFMDEFRRMHLQMVSTPEASEVPDKQVNGKKEENISIPADSVEQQLLREWSQTERDVEKTPEQEVSKKEKEEEKVEADPFLAAMREGANSTMVHNTQQSTEIEAIGNDIMKDLFKSKATNILNEQQAESSATEHRYDQEQMADLKRDEEFLEIEVNSDSFVIKGNYSMKISKDDPLGKALSQLESGDGSAGALDFTVTPKLRQLLQQCLREKTASGSTGSLSSRAHPMLLREDPTFDVYKQMSSNKFSEGKPDGNINFCAAENDVCTSLLRERFAKNPQLFVTNEEHLVHYAPGGGHLSTKSAFHAYLTKFMSCKIQEGDLALLASGNATYDQICHCLFEAGDVLLTNTPTYSRNFVNVSERADCRLEGVPFDFDHVSLDISAYEKRLSELTSKGDNVRGLILINPHNPLGVVFPKKEVIALCNWAASQNLFVIVDESFSFCLHQRTDERSFLSFHNQLKYPDRVAWFWSLSKDFGMPGSKVSIVHTTNRQLQQALCRLEYLHPVSAIAQDFAVNFLSDFDWLEKFHTEKNSRIRSHYEFVAANLQALNLPFIKATAGFFVLIDFRKHLPEASFEGEHSFWKSLTSRGVYLTPGKDMACIEPGWMRLVFACPKEEVEEGFRRLHEMLGTSSQVVGEINY